VFGLQGCEQKSAIIYCNNLLDLLSDIKHILIHKRFFSILFLIPYTDTVVQSHTGTDFLTAFKLRQTFDTP